MFLSNYEEKMDDCNRICPYCGYSYQVESEDYSEDTREEECSECSKKFYSRENFSVTHYAIPDCEINVMSTTGSPLKLRPGIMISAQFVANADRLTDNNSLHQMRRREEGRKG